VINIPKNLSREELNNDYDIRRATVDYNIPLITNARLAAAFLMAICNKNINTLDLRSWDEFFETKQ
jgi:carbamoyl-phosphate synthase large subunit